MLVECGLAPSRAQARDLIRRGQVSVDGQTTAKPGAAVGEAALLEVAPGAQPYVSRGGLKLAAGLDAFGFDARGRVALDIGAATGGFTDVLLRRGAARVYAVDVGHGQLHPALAADGRVVALEGVNGRALTLKAVPEPVTAIVADVSFISLTQVLPAALALAGEGAWLVGLIKPQFEAGPASVGKRGVVRDAAARAGAVDKVRAWLEARPGWRAVGILPSPIAGGSGNAEFLIGAICSRDGAKRNPGA